MPITFEALARVFNNPAYSKRTHTHLFHVYKTLGILFSSAVLGLFVSFQFHLFNNSLFSALTLVPLILGINMVPPKTQIYLIYSVAFLLGTQLNVHMEMLHLFPNANSIVLTALFTTCAVFVSFSLSAFFAQRASYLYLYGLLSTSLLVLSILFLSSLFWTSTLLMNILLYVSTMILSAYVIVDTQVIMEKAEAGDLNVNRHALELFLDFFNLFIRVLNILREKEERQRRKK